MEFILSDLQLLDYHNVQIYIYIKFTLILLRKHREEAYIEGRIIVNPMLLKLIKRCLF